MARVYYPRCYVTIKAVFENFGEANRIHSFSAIPQSISIHRNSYKQADSWSIEMDAKDFPLPPSAVRSASVEIRIFDGNNYDLSDPGVRDKVAKEPPTITGIVDEIDVNWSDSGRVLRFDGQDYTALFIEHSLKEEQRAQFRNQTYNRRLHQVMYDLLRQVDLTGNIQLRVDDKYYFPRGGQNEAQFGTPIYGAATTKTNRKGFPFKKGDSYWDIMYKIALKHGYILFVQNNDLVLTTPQFIYRNSPRDALFSLEWGNNISELSMARRMGKERVPQIRVTSYDDDSGETVTAVFPDSKQKVSTGIGTKRNEIANYTVYGIKDKQTLKRFAEAAYNLRARSEQTMTLSTMDMLDSNGSSLLGLTSGDAMQVTFAPFNKEIIENMSPDVAAQWLRDRGFSPSAAQVIAAYSRSLEIFRKPLYVKEAEIEWSADSGFMANVTLINFVSTTGIQESGEVRGGVAEATR